MRHVLILALALSGCSFYAPTIGDCTLACGEGGCPSGFTCRGTFCRPNGGPEVDCACRAGSSEACGTDVGECAFGQRTCSPSGEWGECTGGQGPTREICDGKDNDCDGLTDLGPVTQVLEDTGPYEGFWRVHGDDAGFAFVGPHALPDGGADFKAMYLDPLLAPRGESAVFTSGFKRIASVAEGSTIYVGYANGSEVELTEIGPGGQLRQVGLLPDAGYSARIQTCLGPRGLLNMWVSDEETVRIAKWPRDGGPVDVYDLAKIPDASIYWVDATTDGQYAIIEATTADGGTLDAVQDIDQPAPHTLASPYWVAERFRTRGGLIVHLDILDFGGKEVIFWRDFANQTSTDYFVVEQVGRWHDSDFIFDDNEDVIAAYGDEATQRIVLARIEGRTDTDLQVTRIIPDDVVVPSGAYSGNIKLAHVPGDPMHAVFWATRTRVYARRFCAP
ncbi:MAG: hypothetical protein AB1938_20940 [Myxococcota bacterium]